MIVTSFMAFKENKNRCRDVFKINQSLTVIASERLDIRGSGRSIYVVLMLKCFSLSLLVSPTAAMTEQLWTFFLSPGRFCLLLSTCLWTSECVYKLTFLLNAL